MSVIECIFLLGMHCKGKRDYEKMGIYLMDAIENGSDDAIYHLGMYWFEVKAYDKMKIYFYMGVRNGCSDCARALGSYYGYVCLKYKEQEQYYKLSARLGNVGAFYDLGNYYRYVRKDEMRMMDAYLMAYRLGSETARRELQMMLKGDIAMLDRTIPDITYKEMYEIFENIEYVWYVLQYLGHSVEMMKRDLKIETKDTICCVCPICYEMEMCMSYICDVRHVVCMGCYLKSNGSCYCRCLTNGISGTKLYLNPSSSNILA